MTTRLSSKKAGAPSSSAAGSASARSSRSSSRHDLRSSSSRDKDKERSSLRGLIAERFFAFSLFWRTFILLSLLLGGGIVAWVLTLRALEFEPRAVQAAQQVAQVVRIARAAMRYTDQVNRVTLVKTVADQEKVILRPREPGDKVTPYEVDRFTRGVGAELRARLGGKTEVASSVNGKSGLWVSFQVEADQYWLHTDESRVGVSAANSTYFVWIGIALVATVLGSAGVAGLINRPLEQLSFAASRIREGEYDSRLDEHTATREIREVNRGFNRMARELAKIEEDRAVMLAGISHDLRTPLARMRLEAEMSVVDEEARRHMAEDIDQLDAIIDKFMDYARPNEVKLVPVPLAPLVDKVAATVRDPSITIEARVAPDLKVMTDEIELSRVFANLFENARRYGRSPDTGLTRVQVGYAKTGNWVIVNVRDHGPGVPPEKLTQLTTPFYRGDAARTHAQGAGLGLAIVEKALARMGGQFDVGNAPDGGFVAHLRLRRSV